MGTWPPTQACTLTRNRTGDPLVHRPVLSPLSHTSQGSKSPFWPVISVLLCLLSMLILTMDCHLSREVEVAQGTFSKALSGICLFIVTALEDRCGVCIPILLMTLLWSKDLWLAQPVFQVQTFSTSRSRWPGIGLRLEWSTPSRQGWSPGQMVGWVSSYCPHSGANSPTKVLPKGRVITSSPFFFSVSSLEENRTFLRNFWL